MLLPGAPNGSGARRDSEKSFGIRKTSNTEHRTPNTERSTPNGNEVTVVTLLSCQGLDNFAQREVRQASPQKSSA